MVALLIYQNFIFSWIRKILFYLQQIMTINYFYHKIIIIQYIYQFKRKFIVLPAIAFSIWYKIFIRNLLKFHQLKLKPKNLQGNKFIWYQVFKSINFPNSFWLNYRKNLFRSLKTQKNKFIELLYDLSVKFW